MKALLIKIGIVGCCALFGLASRFLFKMKPDNRVEQFSERIIKARTGLDIDLSPDTTKVKNKDKKKLKR